MSKLDVELKNFTLALYQKQSEFHKWYKEMNKMYPCDYPLTNEGYILTDAYREWLLSCC